MFHTPPEDDVRWQNLLAQFDATLVDNTIPEDANPDQLLDGVREAIQALESMGFSAFSDLAEAIVVSPPPSPTSLTVVVGGREDAVKDETARSGTRPDLRIAAVTDAWFDDDSDLLTEEAPLVQAPPSMGHIRLGPGERQTLLHAIQPRAYRIFCAQGFFQILVDGQPLDNLRAGQSLDVEAHQLRVCAPHGGQGHYARLT